MSPYFSHRKKSPKAQREGHASDVARDPEDVNPSGAEAGASAAQPRAERDSGIPRFGRTAQGASADESGAAGASGDDARAAAFGGSARGSADESGAGAEGSGESANPHGSANPGDPANAGADAAPAEDVLSRAERMGRALDRYRAELEAQVEDSADEQAIVDLTNMHPGGRAAFAAGSPTLVSSLIREEKSQQRAFASLAALREKIAAITAEHGYAPTQLAIGTLTWTELPAREPSAELSASYEDTGELKLDPDLIERAQREAESQLRGDEAALPERSSDALGAGSSFEEPAEEGAEGSAQGAAASSPESAPEAAPESASASAAEPAPERTIREVSEPVVYQIVRLEYEGSDARITQTPVFEVSSVVLGALRTHGTPVRELRHLERVIESADSAEPILDDVRRLARIYLPGAAFRPRLLLGSFTDPARAMLDDVEAMRAYIKDSGLVAAVEGDAETRRLSSAPLPPANTYDRAPEAERGVGDHDALELAAIEAVATGRDLVVNTPPGSHAVETLAGIVADAAASGRSVLYVPGSQAAAEALKDELETLGVDDLVLDATDVDEAALRIRTGLRQPLPALHAEETLDLRARLTSARHRLENYVAALHTQDPEWHTSLYDVLERLAALTEDADGPATRVRLPHDAARRVLDDPEATASELREAARLGAFAGGGDSLWSGSAISSDAEARRAYDVARRLAEESLPIVMSQSQRAAGETHLQRATTFAQWLDQVDMFEGVEATLDVFQPGIYERSAQDMVVATATDEWRRAHGEDMKRSQRRALAKRAQDYVRPGVRIHNMHAALTEVQRQRDVWRRYSSEDGWPQVPAGLVRIRATVDEVRDDLAALGDALGRDDLVRLPFEELLALVRRAAAERETLEGTPRRNRLTVALRAAGFGELLRDLAERGITEERVGGELDLALANSLFEQLVAKNPDLASLSAEELSGLAADVRRLDARQVTTLPGPVRRAVVSRMRDVARKAREETIELDAALRDRGVAYLSAAMLHHRDLVQAARPVWIMPALMVTRFVPCRPWADLVILDGIGHAPVSSTVSIMTRGSQVVLVGDLERADDGSAFARFAAALPVVSLPTFRGFYDEFATEFLTARGLAAGLSPIPAVGADAGQRLTVVDGRGVPSPITGMVEGPTAEVNAVVDAVVDHYLTHPERSLGVVSISRGHAERVRQAVREVAERNRLLARALQASPDEPFEVVTLDGAANLHRDSILLTVGVGKTTSGRVLHTFGDLGSPEGVEGLVAAIAAAREHLAIVSSIGPEELDLEGVTSEGTLLLADLLQAAASSAQTNSAAEHPADSDALLRDLAARVRYAGLSAATNYGYENGPRIPLAVGRDGEFRLAVLWDDAEYVAETSLRRRDRYWPEILEAHGWQVYRTYSTSVFLDPDGEIRHILARLEGASAPGGAPSDDDPAPASVSEAAAPIPGNFGADSWETFDPAADEVRPAAGERSDASAGAGAPGGRGGAEGGFNAGGSSRGGVEGGAAPGGSGAATARGGAFVASNRGPAPKVTRGLPLAAYTDDELDAMTAWIASDGVKRSETELMEALRSELDIRRRGLQIEAILRNVVRRSGLADRA